MSPGSLELFATGKHGAERQQRDCGDGRQLEAAAGQPTGASSPSGDANKLVRQVQVCGGELRV